MKILSTVLAFILSLNLFAVDSKPKNIWHQMPFIPGGDLGQYSTTMGQNRDEVRKMFWEELMGEVQKLADKGVMVEMMIEPMANILLMFDQLHDVHKAKDIINIDFSIENQFKAALDSYFRKFDIRDGQRKIQISKGMNADFILKTLNELNAKKAFGEVLSPSEISTKLQNILTDEIDFVSYGTFSSLGKGQFQLTYHLFDYKNGVSRDFIARGNLIEAVDRLAFLVFDYFQANIYEEWKNPNAGLTWLPMPINPERDRSILEANQYELYSYQEAKTYCEARGYRLPYARELLLAETGTKYKTGGISALYSYAHWAVKDRRETNENVWIIPANSNSTSGIFMQDGSIAMKGVFWCVKGNPSADVVMIDKLWQIVRKSQNKNLEVFTAAKTLLFEKGDYNAKASDLLFWNGQFVTVRILDSVEEALDILSKNQFVINWK